MFKRSIAALVAVALAVVAAAWGTFAIMLVLWAIMQERGMCDSPPCEPGLRVWAFFVVQALITGVGVLSLVRAAGEAIASARAPAGEFSRVLRWLAAGAGAGLAWFLAFAATAERFPF